MKYQLIIKSYSRNRLNYINLMMIIKTNNGTVLDINTDAVSCVFGGDELPFALDGLI